MNTETGAITKRTRVELGLLLMVASALLGAMGRQDTHDSLIGSLLLNISKAIATGWQPEVSLVEGLRMALSAQDA